MHWLASCCRDPFCLRRSLIVSVVGMCAEDVRPAPNGWILNVYAAAVTPEPVPAPAPRNNH